jgi:TRAP-type C4-dicarboxylate transport system permease small subunit
VTRTTHDGSVLSAFSPTTTASRAPAPRHGIVRALQRWTKIEGIVVGILTAVALVIVAYTIFVRFLFPSLTPIWADEVTVYVVIWATFIACSGLTAENGHVRADLVTSLLGRRGRAACELVAHLCGLSFAVLLAYYGTLVAYEAWDFGDLSTTTLRFPMWIYYVALPVGAALIALRHGFALALAAAGIVKLVEEQ